MAEAEQGPQGPEGPGAAGTAPEDWRDWAGGVPSEVLAKVAQKHLAQTAAAWAAWLQDDMHFKEHYVRKQLEQRKRDGNSLFVFARVCKRWRKAQLKVEGPLRTRVESDVILPGSVALAKWALAEGCPREGAHGTNLVYAAASQGHLDVVRWLVQEQGFAVDEDVMWMAARSGNLRLVQWLRGEGCPWDSWTCTRAVERGHAAVLRWARENGCEWNRWAKDRARRELLYEDDLPMAGW